MLVVDEDLLVDYVVVVVIAARFPVVLGLPAFFAGDFFAGALLDAACLVADFLVADCFVAVCFGADFLGADFFGADFFAADFLVADLVAALCLAAELAVAFLVAVPFAALEVDVEPPDARRAVVFEPRPVADRLAAVCLVVELFAVGFFAATCFFVACSTAAMADVFEAAIVARPSSTGVHFERCREDRGLSVRLQWPTPNNVCRTGRRWSARIRV
ncbi:MAG: hypothetical protein ACRDPG_02870 [Nocardioidaceae bacterium]